MARIPWLLWARFAAQGIPLLVALVARRRLTPARKGILLWCAVLLGFDAIALTLALNNVHNLWLTYVVTPLEAGIPLWVLSRWQGSERARRIVLGLLPVLLIFWLATVLLVENVRTFSVVAEPFAWILVMGVAIWTLFVRVSGESGLLRQHDWFWIGMALAVYAGTGVALPPTAFLLLPKSPALVLRAYEIRAVFAIFALLLVARGLLTPPPADLPPKSADL